MTITKLTLKHSFVVLICTFSTILLYFDKITETNFMIINMFIAGYLFKNGHNYLKEKLNNKNGA